MSGRLLRAVIALCFVGGALVLAGRNNGWRGAGPAAVRATRAMDGRAEGCLDCHGATSGLDGAHAPATLGCAACHLGDPTRSDAEDAHRGMERVPGNLDTVSQTCGSAACHALVGARVLGSPMNTARGIVAVDRFAFGEQPTPDGKTTLDELGTSAADSHIKALCSTCHLGHRKDQPGPVTESSRGGGCVACHLAETPRPTPVKDAPARFVHPGLTLRVGDAACFGCHSRSGRISLAYAGLREITEPPDGMPVGRRLLDGRPLARSDDEHPDDVHHARGMACIDCHSAQELMGDGSAPLHEEQATHVRCTTCHRPRGGPTARMIERDALDAETAITVKRRDGQRAWPAFLVEDRSGEPLTNARPIEGEVIELVGKVDGKSRRALPPSSQCQSITGHERLSCQSCHAAWAPRCAGCHTQRDPDGPGGTPRWSEYDVAPEAAPPTLGLLTRDGTQRIEPFVPGMILTLNRSPPTLVAGAAMPRTAAALLGPETRFLRAYAYAAPHTITRTGRSCRSCHLDPVAYGWGRGTLALVEEAGHAAWRFSPAHSASRFDGLPEDSWIAFDSDGTGAVATRSEARPLDRAGTDRMLAAGACMTCHDPSEARGRALFERFAQSQRARTARCRVPEGSTVPHVPAGADGARRRNGR